MVFLSFAAVGEDLVRRRGGRFAWLRATPFA